MHIHILGICGSFMGGIAVLEPRSNTMKMGVMKDQLAASLAPCGRDADSLLSAIGVAMSIS